MIELLGVMTALVTAFIPHMSTVALFGFGCLMLVGITTK